MKSLFDYILNTKIAFKLQQMVVRKMNPAVIFGEWWTLPMGGQARRTKKVIEIFDKFNPGLIIETGTFIGSTTPVLGILSGVPVVTIELDKRLALRNQKTFTRLYPDLSITQKFGSSEKQIIEVLERISPEVKIFAYLDAHWFDYLPVTDELFALANWGGDFIALIDDFENPYDPNYGFDEYRNGNKIGKHLIPKNLGLRCFVPSMAANLEGVCRRGTAYVFSKSAVNSQTNLLLNDLLEV